MMGKYPCRNGICFLYHRRFHNFRIGVIWNEQFKSFHHSLESATFSSARDVILVAVGAASSVQRGETLEQPEAFSPSSPSVCIPRPQESTAQDRVPLLPVLFEREGNLLRSVVDLVVELEDEHLDEDDEADEGEGAARLGQDALVVAGDAG